MKKHKSYCHRCDYITNHSILYTISQRNSEEEEYNYEIIHEVVKCDGCETISFRKEFIDFEHSYPDENGDWISDITITTYPGEIKEVKTLDKTYALPEKIKLIYQEAISTFNSKCPILTGVAFRAIIEAICLEEKVKGQNLRSKINNLVKQKLLTEKEADRLHPIRFIGNDSVHEMKVPKDESLWIVLKIIEHLLENLYLIDYQSDWLLETLISKYEDFEQMLDAKLITIAVGDEVPLAKILGKDVRRFNNTLSGFETTLIDKIKKGNYQKISIGKLAIFGNSFKPVQHFIKYTTANATL